MPNNPIKYSDLVSPDNSITDLIKQLQDLLKTYNDTAGGIKAEAIQLTQVLKGVSGATDEGRTATKRAADDADRLAKAQRELAFAKSETAKKIAELKLAQTEQNQINKLIVKLNQSAEGSYNRLSAQYSLNKIAINNMSQAERDYAEETEGLITKTRELYEEMKRLQEETGKHQLNVGNYPEVSGAIAGVSDKVTELIGLNNAFGQSILALGRGGAESKAVFTAMADGAKALGASLMGLLTNPVFIAIAGIAGAGVAFKWWYDYNAGLVEATRLTQQFTGKSGDDLKAYRNQVQAIADTFDVEFKETLIAANALSKQFGIDANEALQLIQDGFVAGANANGEFIDTLKEYPAYFKEAGISADQFVAIVAQTNKAGIFSDKGVDAIKEANLRLREMTTATAEALEGIGISSEQVQADLQSGAKTTFQVMQEVSAKLNELPESSAAVGTAIADIFGGPGEDAGLQYLQTLKDISTNLDDVKTKAGILGQLQEEQLQSQLELQNALAGLFDLTGGNFETLQTRVKVFINGALTGLIKGVINLANYMIDMYNNSLFIRAAWQGIVVTFKNAFDTIGNIFGFFMDILRSVGSTIKGVFTLDWDEFKEGLTGFANALPNLVKASVDDVRDNMTEGIENINNRLEPITIPVIAEADEQQIAQVSQVVAKSIQPIGKDKDETKKKTAKDNDDTKKKIAKDDAEKAYKRQLDLARNYEDSLLELEADQWEKRKRQTTLQYERQIEDLRHRLTTEKDLTEKERENINNIITTLAQRQTQELLTIEQERQMAAFDIQQKLAESEFNLLKTTEEEKTKFRLNAEKKRLQKILELNKTLSNEEKKIIQNRIAAIDSEIANTKSKDKDIYSVFGLNLDDDTKAGIDSSVQYAMDALNTYIDEYIAAANRKVEAADRDVEAAQRALEVEIENRNAGYAHNVATAQKELDMAKRNQEKALREQEKAQKAQAALQTVMQIGDMVTASALIWSQLGFPWAIPAIAVMWGSFAASKIKAAQLAKTQTYGDGGVELLQGGSHQSGNDIDFGTRPDGTRRRAEGGEFFAVINKRNSRRFRHLIPDIVHSLNNGTFPAKYMNAYATGDGLTLNIGGNSPDLRALSDDVREIKEQNKRRVFVDANGNIIEVYKNLRRKIKS